MLIKATKFCKQKCYFLAFFCPADDQVAHYITMCKRHSRAVPDNQKASVKELVVDNSTNNSFSNLSKISVFGKGKYCFHGPKRSST